LATNVGAAQSRPAPAQANVGGGDAWKQGKTCSATKTDCQMVSGMAGVVGVRRAMIELSWLIEFLATFIFRDSYLVSYGQ
jgi:hypothetical protein